MERSYPLNPEIEFLIDCCAPNSRQAVSPASLNWDRLLASARRHQLLPLLAARLEQISATFPTHLETERLRKAALAQQLRSQHLYAQWRRLLDEFDCAGIPVITLKGPLLAKLAYHDPGLRVFADLDLLVRPHEVPRAARLLEDLDFVPQTYDEGAFRSSFFNAVEADFYNARHTLHVDLHWRLSPRSYDFGPDGEELWERAVDYRFEEGVARGLSPEDQLIHLTVHAARHGWSVLSQAADIAYLLDAVEPDWDLLLETAADTRSTRMVAVGVMLAVQLFRFSPRADVIARLEREPINRRTAAVAARLTSDAVDGDLSVAPVFNSIRLIEHSRDRLRYLASSWLEPTLLDWQFLPLPRRYYSAYYLVRQVRLVRLAMRRLAAVKLSRAERGC